MQIKKFFGRGVRISAFSAIFLIPVPQAKAQDEGLGEDKYVTFEVKDRDLHSVVEHIRAGSGVNVILDEGITGTVTLSLAKVPWRQALELAAEKAGCVVIEVGSNLLKIEKPPKVHFSFENADVTKVIDAIAKVSGANIIVGPEVKGTVSVRLNDVPYRDALETVAKTLGYVVVAEKRGILRITDPVTLKAQTESRAFQLRFLRPPGPYTPMLESDFVNGPKKGGSSAGGPSGGASSGASSGATAAAKKKFQVLEAFEKALSPHGRMDYIEGQNVLIVNDVAPVLDRVQKMIERLDVEPKQIFVDVKFVTTTNTGSFNLGMDYGAGGPQASFSLGQIPIEYPFKIGGGGFEDGLIVHNGSPSGPFANDGSALGEMPGEVTIPNTVFGALNFQSVAATLRLLKSDGMADIMQAPKIIALDHQPSTIFVGDKIPYAEAKTEQGQAGGLSLSVQEASKSPVQVGFQLLIIPHTIPGTDRILMDVIPTQNSLTGSSVGTSSAPAGFDVFTIGASGLEGTIALPRVSSSTIATSMILESGHTAVIGGLSTMTKAETERGIPLLMDIPLLGWLFKNKSSSDERRNLMVLITPSLLRTTEESDHLLDKELKLRSEQYRSRLNDILAPGKVTADASASGAKPEGQ